MKPLNTLYVQATCRPWGQPPGSWP